MHLRCKKGRYEKHDEDVLLFAVLAESYTAAANGGHVEYRSVQGGIWEMGGSTGEEKKERCKWRAGEGGGVIFGRRSGKGESSSAGEFSTRCKFSAGD